MVYRNVDGRCERFYTKYHSQYYETGYYEPEGQVYTQDAQLYGELNQRIPNFSQEELEINQYKLYYRPYAHWSISCQNVITTKDMEALGM